MLRRYIASFSDPGLRSEVQDICEPLKGNAILVVSISWSKVLNKPFIMMQEFTKSA